MINITKEDLSNAYNKLKKHVFYDTSDLFIRKQISIFESNKFDDFTNLSNAPYKKNKNLFNNTSISIHEKFEIIAESINNYHNDTSFFDSFFNNLKINFLPKQFDQKKEGNFISNKKISKKYCINSAYAFIDIPTELHLITVLWIIFDGKLFDQKLESCCFGNRLNLNKRKDDIVQGSSLFKPYPKQYQYWRDNAVKEAKIQLRNNNDIIFLNLDIKDYYYSINLDLNILNIYDKNSNIYQSKINLIAILKRIHREFTNELKKINFPFKLDKSLEEEHTILPIGLLSSYILGNWYLDNFDKNVINKIKPVYYGRYVDDLLFVIKSPKLKNSINDIDSVNKYVESELSSIFNITKPPEYLISSKKEGRQEWIKLKGSNYNNLYCRNEKALLYYFDAKESDLIIDKLKRELEEKSSEFRDFPDESDKISFEDNAYHLLYDGTEGKIRTLKDYKENRYGLSVYLAKRIFASLRYNKLENKKRTKNILKFFKGKTCLDSFRLWEKIFVYFLVNNDHDGFVEFYIHSYKQIKKIEISDDYLPDLDEETIRICLGSYLDCAFELALSLNPSFVKKNKTTLKKLNYFQNECRAWYMEYSNLTKEESFYIKRFRESNLIRHKYIIQPLINYTNFSSNSNINLTDIKLPTPKKNFPDSNFEFNNKLIMHSPRPIRFWECCTAMIFNNIFNKNINKNTLFNLIIDKQEDFYLEKAFAFYKNINSNHIPEYILNDEDFKKSIYKLNPIYIDKNKKDNNSEILQIEFAINNNDILKKPRISFANTEVKSDNIMASLRGTPILNVKRYNTLQKILKETREERANILLLPENFLPYELLSSLIRSSVDNNILTVTGLEHLTFDKISFNFIVTILPVLINNQRDAVVVIRLKNHYSHEEKEIIRGENQLVPKPNIYRYDLFNWRNVYFSPYYCFELTDSIHRSIFRSKIDLLIASEWNPDTPYFSNIVESLARDLHAYIAQVNTSQYGDSRLTQPSRSEIKDILKLKGGKNDTILIGEIDLALIREFQRKQYNMTKDDDNFKPLPPDYDHKNVLKRIRNELIL